MLIEAVLAWTGVWPRGEHLGPSIIAVNWTWLLTLPLCGALGADIAQRAGATARERVLAAAVPAMAMCGIYSVMAAVELPMQWMTGQMTGINTYALDGVAGYFLGQVFLPGLMLVSGSLPFAMGRIRTVS
jgi:hypothetical protein